MKHCLWVPPHPTLTPTMLVGLTPMVAWVRRTPVGVLLVPIFSTN